MVSSRVNEVRLYTRTVRSEQAVATSGNVGCGADCHVLELEGGDSVARGEMTNGVVVSSGGGISGPSMRVAGIGDAGEVPSKRTVSMDKEKCDEVYNRNNTWS